MPSDSFECDGVQSCAESNITLADNVWITAHLGAQNSIIQSYPGDTTFYVSAEGHEALNGAQIICLNDTACTVACRGISCTNLTLTCESGGLSCFTILCNNAIRSDICPDGYELPSHLSFPSLTDIPFSTLDNSNKTCHTPYTGT